MTAQEIHILEPSPLGHRPWFVRWITQDPPPGWRWVIHSSAEAVAHPAIQEALHGPQPARLCLMPKADDRAEVPADLVGLLRLHWRRAARYHRHARQHIPAGSHVLIPFLDDLTFGLALRPDWLRGYRLAAIGMRGEFDLRSQGIDAARSRWASLKEWLLLRLLRRGCLRSYLTNQLPVWHRLRTYGDLRRRCGFAPDPAEEPVLCGRVQARTELGWPSDGAVLLCYGSLSRRKGLARLLAVINSPEWPPGLRLVVAGRADAEVSADLASPAATAAIAAGRLVILPGRIEPSLENRLFQAADAIWVVYHGHAGSSGVLVLAGRHARPVIASEAGLIGWYARRCGAAVLQTKSDDHAVLAAVRSIVDQPEEARRQALALQRDFARHQPQALRRSVFAALAIRADSV